MGMTSAAQALTSPLIGQGSAPAVAGQAGGKGGQVGTDTPTADAFAALLALMPGAQPVVQPGGQSAPATGPATGTAPATGSSEVDGGSSLFARVGPDAAALPGVVTGPMGEARGQGGDATPGTSTRRGTAGAGTLGQLLSPAMRGWAVVPPAAGSSGTAGAGNGAASMEAPAPGLPQPDAALPQFTASDLAEGPAQAQAQGQTQTQNVATAATPRTVFSAAAAGVAVAGRTGGRERSAADAVSATGPAAAGGEAGVAPLRPARHHQTVQQMTGGDSGQGSAAGTPGVQGQGDQGQGAIGSATGQLDGQGGDAATQTLQSGTPADTARATAADAPRAPASVAAAIDHGGRAAQAAATDPAVAAATDTSGSADTAATTGQDSAPQSQGRPEQMLRMPAHHIPVFALNLMRRFESGARAFQLRLDPPELGKVEVKLTVGPDRSVEAVVTTERPEALAELQRAARDLAAALQEAGLDLIEGGLSFQLDQSGQDQTGGQADGQLPQDAGTAAHTAANTATTEAAAQPAAAATDTSAPRRGGAAHDIWQRARVAVSA